MKNLIGLFSGLFSGVFFMVGIFSCLFSLKSQADVAKQIKEKLQNFEILEARQLIKNIDKKTLSPKDWLKIRQIIQRDAKIGWYIITYWDSISPVAINKTDKKIKSADELVLQGKFVEAAIIYQDVIKKIVAVSNWQARSNFQLYLSLLHSLGRAFYGAGKFSEAYQIYQSIPSSYPFFKQVQFERMWTAYRLQRVEYALGAIATQSSGFFSKFMEPESYLLQFYIYKRMCRDAETKLIVENVNQYQALLKKNKLPLSVWIKKDIETLSYRQALLLGRKASPEYKSLMTYLQARMNADVKRVSEQMDLVKAHLDLSQGPIQELKSIKNISTLSKILNSSNEKWDVDDHEVWFDELGRHVFIGANLCK